MRRPLAGRAHIRSAGSLRIAVAVLIAALSLPAAHAQDHRTRYGRAPSVEVQQAGLNNRAGASQNGSANAATIAQAGSQQSGVISQNGDGNTATIRQFGKANTGTISQTGADNTACLIQVGKHLSADIVQVGDGQARGVIQTRKGTREISPDRCDVQMTRGFLMRSAKAAR